MTEEDISSLVSVFEDFFTGIYKERINNVLASYPNRRSLEVNYDDLDKFDTVAAEKLVKAPEAVIDAAEEAIRNMDLKSNSGGEFKPHVRFFNAPGGDKLTIERLSSERLNELVSFRGIVTKRTDVMHKVKIANYSCQACGNELNAIVTRSFKPPKMCPSCKKLALVPNEEKSRFTDIQKSEVQDLLERVRGGAFRVHSTVKIQFEDDLVNAVSLGEDVEITGILHINIDQNPKQKNDLVFDRYVEVIHAKSLKRGSEESRLAQEDIDRIKKMSKEPAIEKKIISSIAPGVYGYEEVKTALALQLFGGTHSKFLKGEPVRDSIHILLVGDSSTAIRLIREQERIATKSYYFDASPASGGILTPSFRQSDSAYDAPTTEAGALVLASGGILTIDNFEKIDKKESGYVDQAMKDQRILFENASFVTKTSFVAMISRQEGYFSLKRLNPDSISLSLLSGFDAIFDLDSYNEYDEEKDLNFAEHVLTSHIEAAKGGNREGSANEIDRELLRKYISYAHNEVKPVLSGAAKSKIKEHYLDLKRRSQSNGSVQITPRHLETIVRFSEAHAKMRLSDVVELADSEAAIRLMEYVLKKVMADQETGRLDVDIITTGKARAQVEKIETILDIIKEKTRNQDMVPEEGVLKAAEASGMDPSLAKRILSVLMHKGEVYEKEGWIALVGEK